MPYASICIHSLATVKTFFLLTIGARNVPAEPTTSSTRSYHGNPNHPETPRLAEHLLDISGLLTKQMW